MSVSLPVNIDRTYTDNNGNTLVYSDDVIVVNYYDSREGGDETSWSKSHFAPDPFLNGSFQTTITGATGWSNTSVNLNNPPDTFVATRFAGWHSTDLLDGATVTTHSGYSSYGPENMVNIHSDEGWRTSNANPYANAAVFDLGSVETFNCIWLKPAWGEDPSRYVKNYHIGVSSSGYLDDDLDIVISGTNTTNNNLPIIHYLPSPSGIQYVKFFADTNYGGTYIQPGMISAFNSPQWSYWGTREKTLASGTYGELSQSVDLTSVDEIYYDIHMYIHPAYGNGQADFYVDSTEEISYAWADISSDTDSEDGGYWTRYEQKVDVSGYTGSHDVGLRYTSTQPKNAFDVYFDDVKVVPGWCTESVSSTRGHQAGFPDEVYIVSDGLGLSIIESTHLDLWMRFEIGRRKSFQAPARAVYARNGKIYCATSCGLIVIDFTENAIFKYTSAGKYYKNSLLHRNDSSLWLTSDLSKTLSSSNVYSVSGGYSDSMGYYVAIGTDSGLDLLDVANDVLYSSDDTDLVPYVSSVPDDSSKLIYVYGNENIRRVSYVDDIVKFFKSNTNRYRKFFSADNLIESSTLQAKSINSTRFSDSSLTFVEDAGVLLLSGSKNVPGPSYFIHDHKLPSESFSASVDVKIADWLDSSEGGLHFGITDVWPENKVYSGDTESALFLSAVNGEYGGFIENDSFDSDTLSSQWETFIEAANEGAGVYTTSGTILVRSHDSVGYGEFGYYDGAIVGQRFLAAGTRSFTANIQMRVPLIGTSSTNGRPVAVVFGISNGPWTGNGSDNDAAMMALYTEKVNAPSGVYCVGKISGTSWTWDLTDSISAFSGDGSESATEHEWSLRYDVDTQLLSCYADNIFVGSIDCSAFIGDSIGIFFGGLSYSPGFTGYAFNAYADDFEVIYDVVSAGLSSEYVMEKITSDQFVRPVSAGELQGLPFFDGDGTASSDWKTWTIRYDNTNKSLRGYIDDISVGDAIQADMGPNPRLCLAYDGHTTTSGGGAIDIRIRNFEIDYAGNYTISGTTNTCSVETGAYTNVQRDALYVSTSSGVNHLVVNSAFSEDYMSSLTNWSSYDFLGALSTPSTWSITNGTIRQGADIYGKSGETDRDTPFGSHLVYTGSSDPLSARTKDFCVDIYPVDGTGYGVGVAFCRADQDNFYYYINDTVGTHTELGKVVGGSQTILSSGIINFYLNPDKWHRIRIDPTDDNISVYVNGQLDVSVSDSDLSTGALGLISSANQGGKYKDLCIDTTDSLGVQYNSSYGISTGSMEYGCIYGQTENVIYSEAENSAVATSGVLYAAPSEVVVPDVIPMAPRGGEADNTYRLSLGSSFDGDHLLMDYWPGGSVGQSIYHKNTSPNAYWETLVEEGYGYDSGRSYKTFFVGEPGSSKIYIINSDYFKYYDGSSGLLVDVDDPPLTLAGSDANMGTHFAVCGPRHLLIVARYDTAPVQDILIYDYSNSYWYGIAYSIEDYSSTDLPNVVYSEVDDKIYVISDNTLSYMVRSPLECLSWEQVSISGEFPGKVADLSCYAFYRPYDESIYFMAYSGDAEDTVSFTKYDVKTELWSFVSSGPIPGSLQYLGGSYSPGEDALYVILGNDSTSMYKYKFHSSPIVERVWIPSYLPNESTTARFRRISWEENSLLTDDTFTDSSSDYYWYDYQNHSSDVVLEETSDGLHYKLSNVSVNNRIASRTTYVHFPPTDLDITLKVKALDFPTPVDSAGYNYLRIGLTDYLGIRAIEDKRDAALFGVNGLWMVAMNEDTVSNKYTLWKREAQTDTIYHASQYVDFWGNDATSSADYRTWNLVYDHSLGKLTATVDGQSVGNISFSGRGFEYGMYLVFHFDSNKLDVGDSAEVYIRDLSIDSGISTTAVGGSYLYIQDNNNISGVYYEKLDSLMSGAPPAVFETSVQIESYSVTNTVNVFTLFEAEDGNSKVLVCALYDVGSRKVGIYTGGDPNSASSYTSAVCDWSEQKSYQLVLTSSAITLSVDGSPLVSTFYSNLPSAAGHYVSFGSKPLKPEWTYSTGSSVASTTGTVSSETGNQFYKGVGKAVDTGVANKTTFDLSECYGDVDVYVLYDAYLSRPTDAPFTIYHSGVVSLPSADAYASNPINSVNDNIDETGGADANATTIDINQTKLADGDDYNSLTGLPRAGSGFVYLGSYTDPSSIVLTGNYSGIYDASISAVYVVKNSYSSTTRTTTARVMYFRYGIGEETIKSEDGVYGSFSIIDLADKVLLDYYTKTSAPNIVGDDISSFDVHR